MLRLFLPLLLLTSTLGISQATFQKYYGGAQEEYGYSFQETSDGGFIVCGRTFSFGTGGWEGYILRLDQAGDTLWTRTYGNVQYDEVQDIDTTSDGGYILTGHTWTNDWAGDVYLIKLDAAGNVVWDQTYGGAVGLSDKGYSVRQTSDGGYVVCGSTETYGQGGDDVYVIKTNSTGGLLWTRTVGTSGTLEVGREIQQTSDGGYIITGYTDGAGTSFYDVFLIKLNGSGTVLWNYRYGGSSYDFAYTVEETADGGFILGATTNSFGAGNWDAYLIKTDAMGTLQWSKTYGLGSEDRAQAARQTSDGGYIICGRSNSVGSGGYDATLHKTDASGNLTWSKTFGGTLEDQAWFVREHSSGGYVICGYSYSYGAGSRDLVMIKTDAIGASGCNEGSASFTTSTPSTITNTIGVASSGGIASSVPTAMRTTNTVVSTECGGAACPVVAGFNASGATICQGETVNFINTSTNATTYSWFEDGVSMGSSADIAQTFTNSGAVQISMIASNGSCSDTTATTITVLASSSSIDTHNACDSFLWIDGTVYTSSNTTATHTLTNGLGCDSVVTLNLTINYSSSSTDVQTGCDEFLWIDGNLYTAGNNTATHTLTNATGCDSVITLDLTMNYSTYSTDTQSACDEFTWMDGNTYTTDNNTATHTLTNSQGCDSVITLNLTITSIDSSVSQTGTTLLAALSGASYQWLNCNNGFAVIPGETNQSFNAQANGYYAVEITLNGCADTSDCFAINNVGISEKNISPNIQAYPNPTSATVTIDLGKRVSRCTIEVMNSNGQLISESDYIEIEKIDMNIDGPPGYYYIHLSPPDDHRSYIRILKE